MIGFVEKGGKKEIPEQGFYFCTTELLQEHQILTWSLGLKVSMGSKDDTLMWFLFEVGQQLELGQIIDLKEGEKVVAQAIVYDIQNSENLSFWYALCSECQGQGRLELCIEERYNTAFLCCEECYFAYVIPKEKDSFEYVNVFKVKNHLANLAEIRQFKLEKLAVHFSWF